MIDLQLLRTQPELYIQSAQKRGVDCDIPALLEQDKNHRQLITDIETLRAESNNIAKSMKSASEQERDSLKQQGSLLKQTLLEKEEFLKVSQKTLKELCYQVPNLLSEDTPQGADDSENQAIFTFLTPTQFSFTPKDHLTLAKELDLIDFEGGAKVAGSKFYFLKNEAVLLSMALTQMAMQKAISFGYIPLMTPDLAKSSMVEGAGYQPRREDPTGEIYNIESHDLSLIGTSEIAVGGLHSNEILSKEKLPLKYVAFSHCFRTEAGAAGRQSKGLYRVHQFDKVELFQITTPENSTEALEELRSIEESIFQDLKIPYQVVKICSGDLGAPAYKKYDLEAWMPGKGEMGEYGEVTSCSNCTDFQARRLGIRYKDPELKKNLIAHTLNGTGIALSRALIAVLENYQQEDGSVLIPTVLQPYLGGLTKIAPKTPK